jgi:hypothetical protein
MSGTHVYYNGVLLRDCETLEYQSIVEYDESNTHVRFIRTRISVVSTLISIFPPPNTPGYSPNTVLAMSGQHSSTIQMPLITDETMVGRFEEIQQLLSEPRKDFWYAVNAVNDTPPQVVGGVPIPKETNTSSYRLVLVGTGIVPKDPEPNPTDKFVQLFGNNLTVKRVDVLDANAGPKPLVVDVRQVMGGQLMRVQATFEVCRVLSKPVDDTEDPKYDAQRARGIISNTWRCVDSLDDDGNVQHSIKGEIRLKDQRYKPNAMRMFAFPLAFPYARIIDRKYSTDESGLLLNYEFVMRHAGAAPPPGIRKYEATYAETMRMGQKGIQTAKMMISVWGWQHRTMDGNDVLDREKIQKRLLLRGLHTILWSRIRGINKLWDPLPGVREKKVFLVEGTVSEQIGQPRLDYFVSVWYSDPSNQEFVDRVNNMGESFFTGANQVAIPAYDPRWWPIDNEWGRLLDEDGDNPNFRSIAYPYGEEGDPDESDYFTGYYHSPGSQRHTLPRITGRTENADDASFEWARPGGSVPQNATPPVEDEDPPVPEVMKNPASFYSTLHVPSVDLNGDIVMGPLPAVESENYSAIADVQDSGFAYLQWDSEIKTDTDEGVVSFPLSQPRDIPLAKLQTMQFSVQINENQSPVVITPTAGKECSVVGRLHAPVTKRVVSGTATRINKSPQIPDPIKQILHHKYSYVPGSPPAWKITNVETLIKKELLTENPVLMADQCTRQFTVSFRYTYALSNPWAGDENEGGSDVIPWGIDPTIKADPNGNRITVRGGNNNTSPLFYPNPVVYG